MDDHNNITFQIEACRMQNGVVQDRDCLVTEVDPSKTQARIDRLDHDTPYRFIVKAATKMGEGDPNSFDANTLPEDVADGGEPGNWTFW